MTDMEAIWQCVVLRPSSAGCWASGAGSVAWARCSSSSCSASGTAARRATTRRRAKDDAYGCSGVEVGVMARMGGKKMQQAVDTT